MVRARLSGHCAASDRESAPQGPAERRQPRCSACLFVLLEGLIDQLPKALGRVPQLAPNDQTALTRLANSM